MSSASTITMKTPTTTIPTPPPPPPQAAKSSKRISGSIDADDRVEEPKVHGDEECDCKLRTEQDEEEGDGTEKEERENHSKQQHVDGGISSDDVSLLESEHDEEDKTPSMSVPVISSSRPRPSTQSALRSSIPSSRASSASSTSTSSSTTATPTPSSPSLSPSSPKSVNFSHVETRYYPIMIGDNPSVSRGVPITIGWDHDDDETTTHDIGVYDSVTELMNEPKEEHELIIQPLQRLQLLRRVGYTIDELKIAMSNVHTKNYDY